MKVFGIGLSNTGTTSLAKALTMLGYNTKHYPWSLQEIDEFEASVDIPVACRYQELDEKYPGSKFILTTRPFEEWIERRRKKAADRGRVQKWVLDTRIKMYGTTQFNEQKLKQAYYDHHKNVEAYFKHRPKDILTVPLREDKKWTRLCAFLGKDVPNADYPWEKKS